MVLYLFTLSIKIQLTIKKIKIFVKKFQLQNQKQITNQKYIVCFKIIIILMKQTKCHTCDKITQNLLTANCNHKICFNCVKNNKNTHKCSFCSLSNSKNKLFPHQNTLSPAKRLLFQKQKYENNLHSNNKLASNNKNNRSIEQSYNRQQSPHLLKSSRKSHIQSYSHYNQSTFQQDLGAIAGSSINLLCKQHHQPLTLFSKSSKQAICSVCLCNKQKYKDQIMPLKSAQQFLKKQNHKQRQQSRIILNDVQTSFRVIKSNYEQFQKYYSSHVRIVSEIFANLHKQLQSKETELRLTIDRMFLSKLKQCKEIQNDLEYLIETLRTYREENKDTNTLSQSIYVYSSFKVIKKTMKSLNLDYVSYANTQVNLLEYNKASFDKMLPNLLKFHEQQLPLKKQQQAELKKQSRHSSISRRLVQNSNSRSANKYSNKKQSISSVIQQQPQQFNHNAKNKNFAIGSLHQQSEESQANFQPQQRQPQNYHRPSTQQTKKHSKSHNNSLSIYHQVFQKNKHNQSTQSNYNNKPSNTSYTNIHKQQSKKSSLARQQNNKNLNSVTFQDSKFDYQLKTPIKNLLTASNQENQGSNNPRNHSYTNIHSNSNEHYNNNSSYKKKYLIGGYNANDMKIHSSSKNTIHGIDLTEQQKSLYKRLLRTKFSGDKKQINETQSNDKNRDQIRNKQQNQTSKQGKQVSQRKNKGSGLVIDIQNVEGND